MNMNNLVNIKLVFGLLLFSVINNSAFAQSSMLAYNDGLTSVAVSSGINITIQGGFTSQRHTLDGKIDNQGTIYVAGDFVNNNTSSEVFSTSAGSVNLNGSTADQIIGGTYTPGFYDLTVNNTYTVFPQIELQLNAAAKDGLTMTQGNVNLTSNTLTLGTSVASPGTLTYTTGFLYGGTFTRWFGTANFAIANESGHFPMGTYLANYRPLWVGYTSDLTTGGTVSVVHNPIYPTGYLPAAHVDASWNGGTTVDGVSNSTWVVSTANGFTFNGATGIVRFGTDLLSSNTLTDLDASLLASVVGTYGAPTNASVQIEVNRTGLTTANLTNTWRMGTKNIVVSPLPVEFLSFDAQPNGNAVDVIWSTASEFNSDYFEVQRSKDGTLFENVGQVKAAGNSHTTKKYSLVDYDPYQGVSYYRIRQVDHDGKYMFTDIAAVNFQSTNANMFSVFPNPSAKDESFHVNLSGKQGDKVIVVVRDMLGREYYSKVILLSSDQSVIAVDTEGKLASGVYLVVATSNDNIYEKKIVIK